MHVHKIHRNLAIVQAPEIDEMKAVSRPCPPHSCEDRHPQGPAVAIVAGFAAGFAAGFGKPEHEYTFACTHTHTH